MKSITERFTLAVRHLRRESTWLVGISGGRDSVVLLHLLHGAGFCNLILAHFNHGQRKTAVRDEKFVQTLANESKMRVIIDILASSVGGDAAEARLREARLAFFARTAAETGAAGVFLGHHADDVAETFLWNLLRGSGSSGLGGMAADRELATEGGAVRLLRPLLDLERSEIDAYAREHGLEFVEDESNRSRRFTRNRLRHDILPWLEEKLGRPVRQNLLRAATIVQAENEVMDSLVPKIDGQGPLDVAGLKGQPVAIQRRMILRWLRAQGIAGAYVEVESIRNLLDVDAGPARVNLPGDLQARRRSGKIMLARQK